MDRRLGTLALVALAFMAAACDPKDGGSAKKDRDELKRAEAPPAANTFAGSSHSYAESETYRDAVAAANPANLPGRDAGRALFDGDRRTVGGLPGESDGVSAVTGSGGTTKDPSKLYTAPARKNTLTINDVPSPWEGGSPTASAGIGKSVAGVTNVSSASVDPLVTSASGKKAQAKNSADANKDQILIVGDSHSAKGKTIGEWLPKKLKDVNGRAVDVYAVGGASSNWYTPGKTSKVGLNANVRSTLNTDGISGVARLDELVTPRTKVVVIVLGTNHVDWQALKAGKPAAFYHLDASRQLAEAAAAGGRKCFWVGEPDMTGLRGTDPAKARAAILSYEAKLAAKVGGSCTYVRLFDRTTYAGGDGIHYGDYEKVAEAAAAQITLP